MNCPEENHPLLELINVFNDNGDRKLSHDLRPGDVIFVYQYFIDTDTDSLKSALVSTRIVIEVNYVHVHHYNTLKLTFVKQDGRMHHAFPTNSLLSVEEIECLLKDNVCSDETIHYKYFTFKKDCNTVTLTDGRCS